ncbi:potassium-transporting ATPase subunit KdpC [Deinococcus metallilatus]|uniref:Potassium-transporting ATPase KdpC subunit n=1 Tax=Deinococcus metallilatus TaxID=1211322 RepID=A0AAJ5K3D4_9DEIO|nr:potassium-transporting ATPase subunit KdpC [Deinococcus metallilatus]MBB5297209.1 K+-transporting ATPase ATPase C chain [Deinococcus metallilatus]RXJ17348.1 potassium-transporting ATPase subunit KdpC [Deinococcus metallilatus]TLK21817.1 potassium-transporting ATPase subunit KdpC [Deinococcus metallilatus]GMA17226.1 potassium-transporting ATPase KdpC subunit [Deinococcus metallilatus]
MTIPDPYFNETAASTTPRPAPLSRLLLSSLLAAVLFTLICGLAYPLLTTGVAGVLFPNQAQGSLITRDGKVIGSAVLGQNFTAPQYLHGRPSMTNKTDGSGPEPYNAENSGASNWGATNAKLRDSVQERIVAFRKENGLSDTTPVPVDAVTASASGLDPDISLATALLQVGRIAQARGMQPADVEKVIRDNLTPRQLGVLGEARVNVLKVDLALDALK